MNGKTAKTRDFRTAKRMSKSFPQSKSKRPGRDCHFSEQIRKELFQEWKNTGHWWPPKGDKDLLLCLVGEL